MATVRLQDVYFGSLDCACGPFCNIQASDHPNESPFEGVLLVLDEPSTRPPNGSEGHLILVKKKVAKRKLDDLIGMGINYAPTLDRHNPTKKIGVITKAWIEGNKLKVSGNIWKKDFPNAVKDLRTYGMGMSMELADVLVEDKDSKVWNLIDFSFTGATALKKDAAAYQKTSLAAAAQAMGITLTKEGAKNNMADTKTKKKSGSNAAILVKAVAASVAEEQKKLLNPMLEVLNNISASLQTQGAVLTELAASAAISAKKADDDDDDDMAAKKYDDDDDMAGAKDDDDDDDDDDDMAAGKKKKSEDDSDDDDDDDDDDDGDGDDDDDDDLSAELADLKKSMKNDLATDQSGDSDPEPGKLNKNAKKKGSKTTVSASANSRVIEIAAAAGRRIDKLSAAAKAAKKEIRTLRASNREMSETIEEMQAQIDDFTTRQNRRSISPDLQMLLAKGNHDVNEMMASGTKFTTQEVDELLANAGSSLDVTTRIALKNQLYEKGLMEDGKVDRGY